MAISSLQCDYAEIRSRIALLLHINRTPSNWTSDQAADVELIIRAGLNKFYAPTYMGKNYQWSFLRPPLNIVTSPPYSTGTVTVADGTVTLSVSGQPWPSWAASGWLYLDGVPHEVVTRSSSSVLVLRDTSSTNDFAAGTTYVLRRFKYALDNPKEFGGIDGPLYYAPHQSSTAKSAKSVSEQLIRRYYQESYWGNAQQPLCYCLIYDEEDSTVGVEVSLALWPPAESTLYLTGNIHRVPQSLDATNKYPAGGSIHSQTIMAAILSEAELILNDTEGEWGKKFRELLAVSIEKDRKQSAPESLGTIPELPNNEYLGSGDDSFWLIPEGLDDYVLP